MEVTWELSSRGVALFAVSSRRFSRLVSRLSRSLALKSGVRRTLLTKQLTSFSDLDLLPVFTQHIILQTDIFGNGQGGVLFVSLDFGRGGGGWVVRFERLLGLTNVSGSCDGWKRYCRKSPKLLKAVLKGFFTIK